MDDPAPSRTHHLAALTGVRALAALWVVALHTWLRAAQPAVPVHLGSFAIDLAVLPRYGWIGVDIFFILSGFLLTRQATLRGMARADAEDTAHGNWWERHFGERYWPYLRRRILRVYPAYYACITVLLVLAARGIYLALPDPLNLALHLAMTHNVIERYIVGMNGVFWTLPFEWHFYLVFPLLFVLLRKRGPWTLYGAAVAMALVTKLVVLVTDNGYGQLLLLVRVDEFAAGMCMGAWSARNPPPRRVAALAFWTGLALLLATAFVFAALPEGGHYVRVPAGWVRPFWIQAAVTLMLVGLTGERHAGVALFANPLAVALGLVSYSIYLAHVPIIELAQQFNFIPEYPASGSLRGWARIVVGCVPLVLVVATASWWLFERPFQEAGRTPRGGATRGLRHPVALLAMWAAAMEIYVATR